MFLTYLFVPGDSARKITKALGSEADAVIIDLEDAVARDQKSVARATVWETISKWRREGTLQKPFYLRCNSAGTEFFADDMALAKEVGPNGIVLAKCESSADVQAVTDALGEVEVLPLIESVAGVHWLMHSDALPLQVKRVSFGAVDYALDLGTQWSAAGEERRFAMGQLVFFSRVLQLEPPVDAVFPVLNDSAAYKADTKLGKQMGFYGKMVIHPAQLAAVQAAYRFTDEERQWAQRVVEQYETRNTGAFELDGELIDLPVYLKARKILSAGQTGSAQSL